MAVRCCSATIGCCLLMVDGIIRSVSRLPFCRCFVFTTNCLSVANDQLLTFISSVRTADVRRRPDGRPSQLLPASSAARCYTAIVFLRNVIDKRRHNLENYFRKAGKEMVLGLAWIFQRDTNLPTRQISVSLTELFRLTWHKMELSHIMNKGSHAWIGFFWL